MSGTCSLATKGPSTMVHAHRNTWDMADPAVVPGQASIVATHLSYVNDVYMLADVYMRASKATATANWLMGIWPAGVHVHHSSCMAAPSKQGKQENNTRRAHAHVHLVVRTICIKHMCALCVKGRCRRPDASRHACVV